ncbi:MAG: threonylcarbamoyl-AMP synthase [Bacteroidales bacterium]|nr:threonylcarbamoyl-AMP synthase [Bacteroidales bacterium]
MYIRLYNSSIKENQLNKIVSLLQEDGVIIIPTDTLYAFVCDINSHKAAKRLASIKGKTLEKSNFSILCSDISQASAYVKPMSKDQFSFIKKSDAEGFTFVLNSSTLTPKIFLSKKKTIGIRLPKHPVCVEILERLQRPLLVSSVEHLDCMEEEYYCNAELIYEKYSSLVDAVIECEGCANTPSTVVNMTDNNDFIIERQGLGIVM